MTTFRYTTRGGIAVCRRETPVGFESALGPLLGAIDERAGVLLASSYEYPGRYKRWSVGFVDPPLSLEARGRRFRARALNARGRLLLGPLEGALSGHPHVASLAREADALEGEAAAPAGRFAEEERSRQPSIFSIVRAIVDLFGAAADPYLGLYGAFGFDLIYQLDALEGLKPRPDDQRDLVLYLPDELTVVDYYSQRASRFQYDFEAAGASTEGLARATAARDPLGARRAPEREQDFSRGGYADLVRDALGYFRRGDLFEVVPSQSFFTPCGARPSAVFDALRRINPSPYGFLLNLGGEYLVGASPEMFVRVEGRRVETCPISGTIARGRDAIEDAERIRILLNSAKDEAELTMCTDVDRNDKARVCRPGSVRVIGRRQIELYSHLIHTVDHVEGALREGCDALDAFLTHCWAVTVTGAPKRAAVAYLEANEASPRRWYGGAVGCVTFDGNLNTGLTLRTLRLCDGVAELRVGATLLYDSDPDAEEDETHLKAAALRQALAAAEHAASVPPPAPARAPSGRGFGQRVLMVDCEDSFVLTLADYFRQAGAELETLRHSHAAAALDEADWALVVLSPGPGRPARFGVPDLVRRALARRLPVFGVCLGLQGIVEAFGGRLGTLAVPYHGKPSSVNVRPGGRLFQGLPGRFDVGRYHSLFAEPTLLPDELHVSAETDDGVVMAVEHASLPVAGVQFHPESLMTAGGGVGAAIVTNVLRHFARD
ncbi:MAG TPA: anthranilate synthase component I [Polyangiaceae bacterium]|nr:anthranilate synthase component I [Polyangiaceae bacterium]